MDVPLDVNAEIFGVLRDLAAVQTVKPKTYAYARAASVVFWLDVPLTELRGPAGALPKLAGLGPSSMRVVQEVLDTGTSTAADAAVARSGRGPDVETRRALRRGLVSRAGALAVLADTSRQGVRLDQYRGDFQMHSDWSDGGTSIEVLARACMTRGYRHAAVTDHVKGRPISRGLTGETAERQHQAIDRLNATLDGFRVLKGVEANLGADGRLDIADEDLRRFDLVLAAPHADLRTADDQTPRLVRAVTTPGVHILAHPRGRKVGSRPGMTADWDRVFHAAARREVAIEIDGDPSRQDLDHHLARRAAAAGCLFALDSDAHGPDELVYAEIAVAHARLAGIPASRVVNCWPLEKILAWTARLQDNGVRS
jgi:histidinol phosphatase-like PHP family hydrolase